MTRIARSLTALGAVFAVSVGFAACGDSLSGDDVAAVDGNSISKTEFNHWMSVAAASQGAQGGAKVTVPDSPDFTKCVAAKKKSQPKPTNGAKAPTDAQLKTQCKQEFTALRDQVMQFLISARWIEGEAKAKDITLSDAEAEKKFNDEKKKSFPKEADFQKFLKDSGMTKEDVVFQIKTRDLSDKLSAKVRKGKGTVTDKQIADYYNKNKTRFAQPEKRDLSIVLTKTKAKAQQAKRALDSGQSFKTVAKKYSIDEASKQNGGKLPGVNKGQQEKSLDDAVFKAKKGVITGPVKTQFGYYVFEVDKITAAKQQTLAEATPTIKNLLTSQNQQKSLNDFVTDWRKRWKDKTECADDFITQDCKNAPKPKTTSTAAGAQTAPPGSATTTGQ
jgi:foldase protein PrsA